MTCLGETFAGRVGASLLNAIRLPELITTTAGEYEKLAIDLARRSGQARSLKAKLARHRLTTPLFDTAAFTRHLEAAYAAMMERHRAGLPPDHIRVPGQRAMIRSRRIPSAELHLHAEPAWRIAAMSGRCDELAASLHPR